jgi:hypothetical protein
VFDFVVGFHPLVVFELVAGLLPVKFKATARAILREDGKDPS